MASLAIVPFVMGAIYAFALVGGPILHDIKTQSNNPNDIYVSTSDVKDVPEGSFRVIVVVQSKSWLRTAKFSYQSYSSGGTAYLGEKINEAICGDKQGSTCSIPGIKYQTFTVKLEPGKNYSLSYGQTGALGLWTFASSTLKINANEHSKVSGRTHYVYFDEGGYFAAGGRFYTKEQLFK